MKWKEFFKPVGNMTPGETRAYMVEHAEGSYNGLRMMKKPILTRLGR